MQRGDPSASGAVAERLFRLAVDLAKHWDHQIPEYAYALLEGQNCLLGDANGWLGHAVTRRGK